MKDSLYQKYQQQCQISLSKINNTCWIITRFACEHKLINKEQKSMNGEGGFYFSKRLQWRIWSETQLLNNKDHLFIYK